jgi:hypothetical protein
MMDCSSSNDDFRGVRPATAAAAKFIKLIPVEEVARGASSRAKKF